MKRILLFVLFLIPASVFAQENIYPWTLTIFGGGASLCDTAGCFGPNGYAFGASFGKAMGDTWSFELEGTYARTEELLPPRVDLATGLVFQPELERTRVWGGGSFLAKLVRMGERNNFFIALSIIGAYEQQKEIAPEGIFVQPTRDIGIKGGIGGGGGLNLWLGESWGLRPEARFYLAAGDLSGLRYTVGFLKEF